MKRFHVHVHVENLDKSIAFYSALFATEPARVEADYAKWMLDDPRVNFAISTRGTGPVGLDHFGLQTDDAAELETLKERATSADMALLDEGATTCCYANSEKHWVTDPQGLAWEHFHTLSDAPVFGVSRPEIPQASACCAPTSPTKKAISIPVNAARSCC